MGIRLPRSANPHEADNAKDDKAPFGDQTHRTEEVTPVTHIFLDPWTFEASPVQSCQARDRAARDNGPCSCPAG
jgi:hypothetical protein